MRKLTFLFTLLLALPALPALADAPTEAEAAAPHAESVGHSFLVGLKGSTRSAMAAEGSEGWEHGVGAFVAWVVNPGLEIELAAHNVFVAEGEGALIPMELMFKHPFGHDAFQPYLGAGPAFVLNTAEGEESAFGLGTAAGAYYWLTHNVGVMAEVNYNVLMEENVLPELAAGLGIVGAF